MTWAENGDVNLYYEKYGDARETVVFIEGLGYGSWMWNWQKEAVLDAGLEAIVWDNRGTGKSDVPEGPYTIGEMASDLEAVLEDAGVEETHIVGASMGGMIAQKYVIEYDRAKTTTLMCTSPGGEKAVPTPPEVMEKIFNVPGDYDERESIKYKMRPAMTDAFFDSNTELIEQIIDWRLESDASDAARASQAEGIQNFDVSDQLDKIDVPTLIMHGTGDRVVPVENSELLRKGIEDNRLILFDDAPHLFFIERSDEVNEELVEFLKKNSKYRQ